MVTMIMVTMLRTSVVGAGLTILLSLPVSGQPPASGWATLEISATGSYARWYLPASVDPGEPAPLVLLLHGSGARPRHYEHLVETAAETAGCLLVLPKSQQLEGWGDSADPSTISESLRLVQGHVTVDPERIAIAGHSSGGAYAYLLAYTEPSRYSGVFTLAAPFFPIEDLADRSYVAPIRMYYGEDDPNYSGGAYARLVLQWLRLNVPVEVDVRPGYGHSTWPTESMEQGLSFLTGQRYRPLQPTPRSPSGRRAAPDLRDRQGAGPCSGRGNSGG